jgi:hypothetical protein
MNAEVVGLLREAAEWRLLSVLFEYPGEGWPERLRTLASDIRDQRLRDACEAALKEGSAGMHHSIFGPGGPVSPREASYTNGVQLGYLLSEISAFYDAFAYTPDATEPLDHISVEAGFIGYLRLKQAYAVACGEGEKASIAGDASAEFLREHMCRMASRVGEGLAPIAPSYLVAAGAITAERAGPAPVELGVLASCGDEEMACGAE